MVNESERELPVEEIADVSDPETTQLHALTQLSATVASVLAEVARLGSLEQRLLQQEDVSATLLMAYSDLAMLVQAILAQVIEMLDEDTRTKLVADIDKNKKDMLRMIQEEAKKAGSEYDGIARAMDRISGKTDN